MFCEKINKINIFNKIAQNKIMKSKKIKNIILGIVSGVFIGFINGFFGGGGGMIVVPLLTFIFALPDKQAHATAILIILPMSIASSIVYITQNTINLTQLLEISAGFVVGGIIGALLLNKLNNKILRTAFSVLMVGAGVYTLIKSV